MTELRLLGVDHDVHIDGPKAGRSHARPNFAHEHATVHISVSRIGIGEQLADVSQPRRPQQCITQRVQDDVGVTVPAQPAVVLDPHAAQQERTPRSRSMQIVSAPDAIHARIPVAGKDEGNLPGSGIIRVYGLRW